MGKFLNGQVLEWAQTPGPGAAPGPGPDLDRRGPRARGLGPFKNLPIQELAHEQELAHSNLAGVGWGDDFNNQRSGFSFCVVCHHAVYASIAACTSSSVKLSVTELADNK